MTNSAINLHVAGVLWRPSLASTPDERTFEGYPDFFGSFLLDEDRGTVQRIVALNVLFVHFAGLQFEKRVHIEVLELWRVEYQIGQITIATLITIGDACGKENRGALKRLRFQRFAE